MARSLEISNEKKRALFLAAAMIWLAAACSPNPGTPTTTLLPTATPSPTATSPPLNLEHRPLYWFAPLPPQPAPSYDGSNDFMDLFKPEAAWEQSAGSIQVFKLYGGWAQNDSTISELRLAIQAIRQHGLALAVEVGPLIATDDCGFQIEGFAGEEGIETMERIKTAGGELNLSLIHI